MDPQAMQSALPSMNPPVLGSQVPGMTEGLPALSGLSVTSNPMAQQIQSMGRGQDSMLVHMTPGEVNSLQGLARATGGSLTINPHTGLPEAGWLGKLLPTILGIAGAAVGIPTWAMGLGGTAVGTAVTGDLGKGLMAGLGAYGGAGLGNAMGLGGSLSPNGFGLLGGGTPPPVPPVTPPVAPPPMVTPPTVEIPAGILPTPTPAVDVAGQLNRVPFQVPKVDNSILGALKTDAPLVWGDLGKLGITQPGLANVANAAKPGFMEAYKAATNIKGMGNIGAIAGGLGVLNNIAEASAPKLPKYEEEEESVYKGPYTPTPRKLIMPTTSARERKGAEHLYFENVNPVPGFEPYNPTGMAEGGAVPMDSARGTGERTFSFAPSTMPVGTMPALQTAGAEPGGVKGSILQKIRDSAAASQQDKPEPFSLASIPHNLSSGRTAAGVYTPGRERSFGFQPMTGNSTARYMNLPPEALNIPEDYFSPYVVMGSGGGRNQMFARGGEIPLSDGSFVLDARTVSEIGNGSSNAGKEILRAIGGLAVEGPGDGVSDSVPARIGRNQPARVARDEVIVPAEAVRKIGKGNPKRGADKLYALMKKAHAARKKAKRGQDTKLRRGLA